VGKEKLFTFGKKRTFCYKNYSPYSFIVCRRIKKIFFLLFPFWDNDILG
jgi:hypothetical protein